MRPLTTREIERVSGAETIEYSLPINVTLSTTVEANHTTTLRFSYAGSNTPFYTWNSGVALSCYVFSSGFYLTGSILGGPMTGRLTSSIANYGCKKLAESVLEPNLGDDGD